MDPLAHELQREMSRREVCSCQDIKALKLIALRLLDLLEAQHATTLQMMQQGWLPKP
jgi:hypothetical protein